MEKFFQILFGNSYRTTIAGYLFAIAQVIYPLLTIGSISLKAIGLAAFTVVIGRIAKDAMVSGNDKPVLGILVLVIAMLVAPCACAHAGTLTVTLAWDAETAAAGYKIYYGTATRTYTSVVDVKNVTTYKLSGLTCNPCYFAATAYDSSGLESDYSNEVSLARLVPPVNLKTTAILVTLP